MGFGQRTRVVVETRPHLSLPKLLFLVKVETTPTEGWSAIAVLVVDTTVVVVPVRLHVCDCISGSHGRLRLSEKVRQWLESEIGVGHTRTVTRITAATMTEADGQLLQCFGHCRLLARGKGSRRGLPIKA